MRKLIYSISLAVLLIASAPGYGQFGLGKKKDQDPAAAVNKNIKAYEKIKQYSTDKLANDPDFRDEVDQAYSELLRDHKAVAFEKNTHRNSKIYAVNEDRFRMNDQGELYDNLLVQSRINRIGQSLVPKDSDRIFAFRLTADPTPSAETLATGTIYISTGMVSLLDNEAQLAYVLAHEMAHVQLDHWKQKVLMERGLEAYNADQTKKTERLAAGVGIASGLTFGILNKSVAAGLGGLAGGAAIGAFAGSLMNRHAVVSWDRAQEDEADKLGFKAMLDAQYDVREVPKLYVLIETMVVKDTRVGLGFLGDRNRVKERKESAEKLIAEAYKADIDARLAGKGFQGDSAGHRNLMAELKRDNGIMAYYSDMFLIARKNLEEATSIRDNDPTAQYYYGKVLETIGRTPEDRKTAEQSFVKAAQYDKDQQENFGAHLHRALMMIEDNNVQNQSQVTTELDTYVTDYARYQVEYARSLYLPPNINTISEYMRRFGVADWHPTLPENAESVRLTENSIPSNPDAGKVAPKTIPVSAPKGGPCPASAINAARAAGATANRLADMAANGCSALPALKK